MERCWKYLIVLVVASCYVDVSAVRRAQIYWLSPRVGSLAGGTTVNIYGRDFSTDSYTSYSVVLLGQIPCIVIEYTSSPTRLQCVTEPYPEARQYSTYNPLQSSLVTDGNLTTSSGSHNQFTYHWSYTPQIRSVQPNSGPMSAVVELGGYRTSGNYDRYESNSIRLGQNICEIRNREDNVYYGMSSRYSLRYVRCLSTEQRAGALNATMVLTGSSGCTWNHSQSLYPVHDWSLAMYELFPNIHSVTPSMGSVRGGTLITVTGTGFEVDGTNDIALDIDGIPCRVASSTPTEIKCWAGVPPEGSPAIADNNMEYPDTSTGYRFKGSRGVNYMQYDGISGSRLSSLHANMKYPDRPDYKSVYPTYGTTPIELRRFDNYGARFTAFFNSRFSGNVTFVMTNDDEGGVWYARGNNISETSRIITSLHATGYNNFYRNPSQKADTLHLEQGEDNLLVAEFKEGGGGDYAQVGVLIHDTNFTYQQTHQVARETQVIELNTAGLYEVQKLTVVLNTSEIDESDPPMFVVEWGGRQTSSMSIMTLENINASITSLLSGTCEEAFGQELGYTHYGGVHTFENSTSLWSAAWGGLTPMQTNEDSFCGQHSLHVQSGRATAPYPNEEESVRLSDYPYLCLAYKLPPGHSMALAIRIMNAGWHSIPFGSETSYPFPSLHPFWEYSDDSHVQDDNEWHFACTDLEEMLSASPIVVQDPDNDENTIQSIIVEGLGFHSSATDSHSEGFYVDEISFSSENRLFEFEYYLPPARPNDIPIHNVSMEVIESNWSDVVNYTYYLTVIPATCDSDIPLISITLLDTEENSTGGVLEFNLSRHRAASSLLEGNYTLSFESETTVPLPHDATSEEMEAALEGLDGVGDVTVQMPQPLPQDSLGKLCPGRRVQVIFEENSGDLPLLTVDSRNLSGDDLHHSVSEVITGGLFLRPIPGHMLQTAEVTPQLHLRVRGQLAACGGKNEVYENVPSSDYRDYCGFKYGLQATPRVTSISPPRVSSGDTITIRGSGFSAVSSENHVSFDGIQCSVSSSADSVIECVLGTGFAGYKSLYLHVMYSGVANTESAGVEFEVVVDGISPSMGSEAGGTEAVVTGSGFYYHQEDDGRAVSSSPSLLEEVSSHFRDAPECSSGWINQVLIGGNLCTVVNSTNASLTVKTPEDTGNNSVYDIEVRVLCRDSPNNVSRSLLRGAFRYEASSTPHVLSVSPTSGPIQGGETVTINGTSFSNSILENQVLFGEIECKVTSATTEQLTCVASPHSQGEVLVSVIVSGKGKASGVAMYRYEMGQISSVSHCSGSLFGGQVLSVVGSGFGTNASLVDINMSGRLCEIVSVDDGEVICVTPSSATTHQVNNNASHEEYGLGYRWNPSDLTVHAGDSVHWSWTGSQFATRRSVVQVSGPEDTVYDGVGFRSEQSVTGSYDVTFTKPGTYYYISEDYGHIGFRGTVRVLELEDIEVLLTLTLNSVPLNVSDYGPVCNDTGGIFQSYSYSVSATPVILTSSQQSVTPGDRLEVGLRGLSMRPEDNIFVLGGSPGTLCSSVSPPILSTSLTHPTNTTSLDVNTTNSTVTVQCSVPELPAGLYRPVLHVAGRGWAHASLADTVLTVHPRITSAPSLHSGSLRGGLSLSMATSGLYPADLLRTRVRVGNTPCAVQNIDTQGVLTCLVNAAVDDGYSSLIEASSPLAYWSLQGDYHRSNDSYLSSDGSHFFRSLGSLGTRANASVHGTLSTQQTGISGNSQSDQSIQFTRSAFLQVQALEQLFYSTSFSMEFWAKIPTPTHHYRIIINKTSLENNRAHGFMVLLNPCNNVEFWLASGQNWEELQSANATECPLITNRTSQCTGDVCNGYTNVLESGPVSLPVGTWHKIQSRHSDLSEWHHVYISWQANVAETDNGTQELAVNGEYSSASTSHLRSSSDSSFEIGGSSLLPLDSMGTWSGLSPFTGFLDEVAYYSKPLRSSEITRRIEYGTQDIQPIWLSVEGVDRVGSGSVPNVQYPEAPPPLNNTVTIDWERAVNLTESHGGRVTLKLEWAMSHGVREVSPAVFESCDLEADYIKQWSPNVRQGQVVIPLQEGRTHYFIDSVVGGCRSGRRLSVQVGNIHVIEWQVRSYEDLVIPEGSGLLFRWSGSYHNVLEMSSPVDADCKFVSSKAFKSGQVRYEWLKDPSADGEVAVSGLSVGEHYFVCSVGDHCQRGMRFTVTVESREGSGSRVGEQEEELSSALVHTVRWLIQDYSDLTVTEGDTINFMWEGFHSLHQVTEDAYTSCNTAISPLYVWGDPSVDNRATIQHLTPGSYYFICSVAGHCSAGMKIKVIVQPNDGQPVLLNPISADCEANVSCHFSYGSTPAHTPQLTSVSPVQVSSNSVLTLQGRGLLPANASHGTPVDTVDVFVGNALCANVIASSPSSSGDDVISCTVSNYEANYYHVDVYVQGKGFVSVHQSATLHPGSLRNSTISAGVMSPYPHVFLQSIANNISPSTGSVLGGTEVVISGSGFAHVSERMSVVIGQIPCLIRSSSHTEVHCTTGVGSSLTSDTSLSVSSTVNGYSVSTTLQFTYALGSTPVLSGLSVQQVRGGETLVISGTMFGQNPRVQVIRSLGSFEGSEDDDECVLMRPSNDTEITCALPLKPAGRYQVLVIAESLGYARPDTSGVDIITYSLSIEDFSPRSAGYGGGIVLTVNGHGFPTLTEDVRVTLCAITCSVLNTSLSALSCILSSSSDSTYQSRNLSLSCNISIDYNDITSSSNESFLFLDTLTPTLTSISPGIGGTGGGTRATLVGSGFLPTDVTSPNQLEPDDVIVSIDGAICEWTGSAITSSEITCQTSSHRTTLRAEVVVTVRGKGRALHEEDLVTFEYIDLWSSRFTWGGNAPPGPGESVYIQSGQTVFLDISPPVLNLILIEGALIFSDTADLHLQAKYIFVNNGTFQVGTEENPFQHRATITLHGNISDPEIPIYGAKVLGVRQGQLDLHGQPRHVTWTRLARTAEANTTSLTLQQEVDWRAGDRLVIAPTGKDGNETEECEVLSISSDNRTIELTRALNFTHHGVTERLPDGNFIEMRAEVGLLSHNVIVEGALLPSEVHGTDQYGAQIFVHRMGPHPTPIRIEHTEVRNSGQAFRLGRYSIHFHLSGNMNSSYIRRCSIHHSFNRAITAHGVHNLSIEGNVAYDIMGHTYFVEDGVETNNSYLYNLGVLTRGSSSLLNTDQLPATFWITNPQNTFIGNAAVASRAYGFWYDLDDFPSGASYTRSVCPNKSPFGEFRNNTAHACNEFGLRIWERYIPHNDSCAAQQPGEATLHDFTTFGNGIHGVELSVVGHVRLSGFKVADNVVNGIEIQETLGEWGGPRIMNSLIISHTSINLGDPQTGGIKTPNTPRLTISNVTFANFDHPSTSCLWACSHCKTFQGGFEVRFEQLHFIGGSERHKTAFKWEFEVLYHDLDGSLTGLPGGGWVVPDSSLVPDDLCTLSVPEFSGNSSSFNGTVCRSQVHFLRMAWNRAMPLSTLMGVGVNVSNMFGDVTVPWRHYRLTHMDGYMFTMPQGYAHDIIWQLPLTSRVDTSSYSAGVYGLKSDSRLWIHHNFVMLPDHVNVGGNIVAAEHGGKPTADDNNFSWFINNVTNTVTYLITGGNFTAEDNNVTYTYSYEPCPPNGCPPPGIDYGPYESRQRRWSEPNSWPSGTLPEDGADVTINSRWRMLVDVSPPSLGSVYVYGELMFEDQRDYNFSANLILIQGPNARMIIGTESSPFTHQVTLTLTGRREDRPLTVGRNVIIGSKAIGVFGNLSIHGVARTHTWTRLTRSAYAGNTTIVLPEREISSWRPGDQIVVAASEYDPMESELKTIASIDGSLLTLTEPLQHNHLVHRFLDPMDLQLADPPSEPSPWWGDGGTMAPEVGLLTHNIVIQGGEDPAQPLETHHYGCRILAGSYTSRGYTYISNLKLDSVEMRYCGQGGYFSPRDPRYSIAFRNNFASSNSSYVRRSSIHHGYNTAIGIHTSNGVEVSENVIWRTTDSSVKVGGNGNVVQNNLAMMTTTVQPNRPLDAHAVDFPATYDVDSGNVVRGNAAAGSTRLAFQFAGEMCLEDNTSPIGDEATFWDNTAHSGLVGLNVLGLPHDCTAIGGFTATYQWNYGVFSSTASSLVATHLKIAVGKVGFNLNVFGPNPVAHLLGRKFISVSDSLIVGSLPGETCITRAPDFRVRNGVSFTAGDHKLGFMMASFNQKRSKMDGTGAWHLMKGYPVIDGILRTVNVGFARFNSTQSGCDYGVFAVGNNPLSPDAVHPMQMTGTSKYNVDLDSLAFFYEPDPAWIVQEDCIDMDCDGPKHALVRDIDGRFVSTYPTEGSVIPVAELRFSNYTSRLPRTWLASEGPLYGVTIANSSQVVEHMGIARGHQGNLEGANGGCELRERWQAYRCKRLQHHMLVIESMDGDTETRRLSPLALDGGDTGTGDYTDLINGPMDHGWCTYYTCLKRLSTFFTVVAEGTDYCVWMTGSPPNTVRLHLLNAGQQDSVRICMWFKTTLRKDVYKNGVFIEPENIQYHTSGAIMQIDGDYIPSRTTFGGANYFDKETQIMHVIIKGSDPIEIRTAPVVQVSLTLAVSLDDFFNVGELINNIAFVLRIDKSKIRLVNIVSEDSSRRFRRSLLATSLNHTSITLELGNPPAPNITVSPPPSVAEEIRMAKETNDSVDLEENIIPEVIPDGSNPLNEDPPDSTEDFISNFNDSSLGYLEEITNYEEVIREIEEANTLGEQLINMILTGNIGNLTNATVVNVSVVPALPPPPPRPPVIPPLYQNVNLTSIPMIEAPALVTEISNSSGGIDFVIPSSIRVSMEPHVTTGHLVHVEVTIYDDNDEPVVNLGLVNPWMCEASLVTTARTAETQVPLLEGVTSVPFVRGVAEFTRLRVDRPGQELALSFRTIPSRFHVTTSVRFTVVAPPPDTPREQLGFVLRGNLDNIAVDSDAVKNSIRAGLSSLLDVDISRISELEYEVTSSGIVVQFDLLERYQTDPPDVLSLEETTALMEQRILQNELTIPINGQNYTADSDSFQYVTPVSPSRVPKSDISFTIALIISASGAIFIVIVALFLLSVYFYCRDRLKRIKRKHSGKVSPVSSPAIILRLADEVSIHESNEPNFQEVNDASDCWTNSPHLHSLPTFNPSTSSGHASSLAAEQSAIKSLSASSHTTKQPAIKSLSQMANPTKFGSLQPPGGNPNSIQSLPPRAPASSSRPPWANMPQSLPPTPRTNMPQSSPHGSPWWHRHL